MAETETPNLKLRKPEIGGSNDVWGNRWNDNADKIDVAVGTNTTNSANSLKKAGVVAERTADDLLLYKAGLVIPAGTADALVTQRFVKDLINALLPIGTVIIWAGVTATIPAGWAFCDGSTVNGHTTPDLRNRFLMQAGAVNPGTLGGVSTLNYAGTVGSTAISVAQMPVHAHSVYDPTHTHGINDPGHTHTYSAGVFETNYGGGPGSQSGAPSGKNTGSAVTGVYNSYAGTSISLYNAGGGAGHDHTFNISLGQANFYPLYYVVCYIMKVALA